MTSPPDDPADAVEPGAAEPGAAGPPPREELDRQVRGHYGNWRDQPRGLACFVVAAFLVLTTVAVAVAVAIALAVAVVAEG